MHHAVLDLGEFLFDAVMYPVRNGMSLCQSGIRIGSDVDLHIDAVAEQPGLEPVDPQNTLLLQRGSTHPGFHLSRAGTVDHLGDGVLEDIPGSLEDKQADYHAGNRVQHRHAQTGAR